jgi:RND family efflux transporter MFP subunit
MVIRSTLAGTPVLLAGLLLLAGLAGLAAPATAQQPALVGVDAVREEPFTRTVEVIGRLVSRRAGVVAARTRGPVSEMRVDVGDRVEQGDVIAVLVTDRPASERDLRAAEVAAAEASLATARAELGLRQQELSRLEGLRKSPAFSKGSFEDKRQEVVMTESEAVVARAELASARARLRLAEIDLGDSEIRAPYSGVVTQRHTEVGAHVDVGDSVVSLIDDRDLEVEADVPFDRIGGLTPGAPVTIEFAGGRMDGKVRAVVPEENALTRTRTVRFAPELEGAAGLAANQSVTVRLPAGGSRNVVTVHKDAILNRKGGTMAVVVAGDAAEIRPVRLGDAVGNRFEVIEGLKPGDAVVVRGNERLRPGQKIQPRHGAQADGGVSG